MHFNAVAFGIFNEKAGSGTTPVNAETGATTATKNEKACTGTTPVDHAESGTTGATRNEEAYIGTSSVDAKYTISGSSATESYDVYGFDISGVVKDPSGFFGKAGIHSATMDGAATLTIGGTAYTVTAEAKGTGPSMLSRKTSSSNILLSVK